MEKFTRVSALVLLAFVVVACRAFPLLDSNEGILYTVEIVPAKSDGADQTERTIEVLKARLNALGVKGTISRADGSAERLTVKVYGKNNGDRVKKFLFTTNKLQFRKVAGAKYETYASPEAARQVSSGNADVLPLVDVTASESARSPAFLLVEKSVVISGADLKDANAFQNPGSGGYSIMFTVNPNGAVKFSDWTSKNIGRHLAIVIDDKVISAPVIRGMISDSGSIDGRFDKASAEDLALSLQSGYLEVKMTVLEERTFED